MPVNLPMGRFASRLSPTMSATSTVFVPSSAFSSMPAPVQPGFGCTSLTYRDAGGAVYLGRTLELTRDLPYQLVHLPIGQEFSPRYKNHPPLEYTTCQTILAVTMADRIPTAERPLSVADFKIVEGLNDAGLTFSMLAYPTAGGSAGELNPSQAILPATDLGAWALGLFKSVAEVKAALAVQSVALDQIALLGGAEAPFHYALHDRVGDSIVLEFDRGQFTVYDNPVGVMTNGPQFSWHLTNLDNYTFLSNVDRSTATFGKLAVRQPDSGIATAGLPASNTSVGRFVKAAYYSQFAEKASDPDQAIRTLAHIMNNFDRPKGISVDAEDGGEGGLSFKGIPDSAPQVATEYTSWTNLTDLSRGRFFLRTYDGLNYAMFDMAELSQGEGVKTLPISALDGMAASGTAMHLASSN